MQTAQFQLHANIEERHWWFVARRQILRAMIRAIVRDMPPAADEQEISPSEPEASAPGARRAKIVDIGCGTGANLAALADEFDCTGIDTSAEAIALATARFPYIQFTYGFAPFDIAAPLANADVVMMTDVLEHVADDRGLLESIVKTLRPGAHLLLTVPADMKLWSQHDEAFGHFRRYDAASLAEVWAGLPVQLRMLSHFNSRLYPLVRGVRAVSRWRGAAAGLANTDFSLPALPVNNFLQRVFAGEELALTAALAGESGGYQRGVSLMAVLRKV